MVYNKCKFKKIRKADSAPRNRSKNGASGKNS